MDVRHTLMNLTSVVIWMMMTSTQDLCAAVVVMIRPVEIKIGREQT